MVFMPRYLSMLKFVASSPHHKLHRLQSVVQYRIQHIRAGAVDGDKRVLELIAKSNQSIDHSDDAVLFGERGDWDHCLIDLLRTKVWNCCAE